LTFIYKLSYTSNVVTGFKILSRTYNDSHYHSDLYSHPLEFTTISITCEQLILNLKNVCIPGKHKLIISKRSVQLSLNVSYGSPSRVESGMIIGLDKKMSRRADYGPLNLDVAPDIIKRKKV